MKKIILILMLFFSATFAQTCNNKTFTLNAYDTQGEDITLYDIISDLAKQCNLTIIFSDKKSKNKLDQSLALINIKNYSLTQLLDLLFSEHNLFYEYNRRKNILKISYYKMKNFSVDYINMSELSTKTVKSITVGTNPVTDGGDSSSSSEENSNSDTTKIITSLTFSFWDKLQEHIEQILKSDEDYDALTNKVLVDRDASIITINGTKKQLNAISKYIDTIEKRMHAQVMIEAYIIELIYNHDDSSGVDWSKFELSLNPSLASSYKSTSLSAKSSPSQDAWAFKLDTGLSSVFNPTAIIKFLNTYGDVDIISNPKVLTLNNQPAVINVGNQLSYLYQSGDISATDSGALSSTNSYNLGSTFVGLSLNIIPEITQDNHIMMRINPVTSTLLNDEELTKNTTNSSTSQNTARNMPPDTKIRQMSSIVKVKDGQRVMIGGLIDKKVEDKNSKVPLLGDIPLFGKLFSHTAQKTQKTELFIILKPTLIKNGKFPSIDDVANSRLP